MLSPYDTLSLLFMWRSLCCPFFPCDGPYAVLSFNVTVPMLSFLSMWRSLCCPFFPCDGPYAVLSFHVTVPMLSFLSMWRSLCCPFFPCDGPYAVLSFNVTVPMLSFPSMWRSLCCPFFPCDGPYAVLSFHVTVPVHMPTIPLFNLDMIHWTSFVLSRIFEAPANLKTKSGRERNPGRFLLIFVYFPPGSPSTANESFLIVP